MSEPDGTRPHLQLVVTPKPARPTTDTGNAERLVDRYGVDIRYVHDWKCWLLWDEQRWRRDSDNAVAELMRLVIRGIFDEAFAPGTGADLRDRLLKHAMQSESRDRRRAAVDLAQSERPVATTSERYDRDPLLLNVENGTLMLALGSAPEALRPHQRSDLLTKMAPVTFDAQADCPRWTAFLDRIFKGDAVLIGFVQEAFGYTLTGSTDAQCLFFLHGEGQNGKSTMVEVMRRLLGDYATTVDFSLLLATTNQAVGPRTDFAQLEKMRLVTTIEAGAGQRFAENVVKNLTGQDQLPTRKLYGEAYTFTPTHKFWLAANKRPVILGQDVGIWRRFRMLPFAYQFPEAERRPQSEVIAEFLRLESAGILNWALAGLDRWLERGRRLETPEIVTVATREYQEDSDFLAEFLAEHCQIGPHFSESHAALYKAYSEWADENGEGKFTMSGRKLALALEERRFHKVRHGAHEPVRRVGLRLLNGKPPIPDPSPAKSGQIVHKHGEHREVVKPHILDLLDRPEPEHDLP